MEYENGDIRDERVQLELEVEDSGPELEDSALWTSDSSIVQELLTKQLYQLDNLDRDIAHAQIRLKHLFAQHAKRTVRITKLRAVLAPQRKLPPELWKAVFLLCSGEDLTLLLPPWRGTCPWTIGQVCSRWRQIALNEPRLWNKVVVHNTTFSSLSVGTMTEMIREVISRSNGTPISLTGSWETGFGILKDEMLEIILLHLGHIRRISIWLPEQLLYPLLHSPQCSASVLESIDLEIGSEIQSESIIADHTAWQHTALFLGPSLRKVVISCMPHRHSEFSVNPPMLPLAQLTSLSLPDFPFTFATAHSILCQSICLVDWTLRLAKDTERFAHQPAQQLVSTTLQSINISSVTDSNLTHFLDPLTLPSLRIFHSDCTSAPQLPLISLIRRSSCSIQEINHYTQMGLELTPTIDETLLQEIPNLVKLETTLIVEDSALTRIKSGELVPKLKVFCGYVYSPELFGQVVAQRKINGHRSEHPGPSYVYSGDRSTLEFIFRKRKVTDIEQKKS